jgi:hypothetical protein
VAQRRVASLREGAREGPPAGTAGGGTLPTRAGGTGGAGLIAAAVQRRLLSAFSAVAPTIFYSRLLAAFATPRGK